MKLRRQSLILATVLALTSYTQSARAVTLQTSAFGAAGDGDDLSLTEFLDMDDDFDPSGGLGSSISSSASGNQDYEQGMTFSASAAASAGFGLAGVNVQVQPGQGFRPGTWGLLGPVLGADATGFLAGSVYNPDGPSNGDPNYFVSWGESIFTDTLSYAAPQSGFSYTSTYHFHLSGSILGNEAFAYIELTHGTSAPQTFYYDGAQDFDLVISSSAIQHGFTDQEISLRLLASYQIQPKFWQDGSDVYGEASFGSTLGLLGIEVRDEFGNLAPEGTVTSDSGQTYEIVAPVPEPGSVLLLGLGLLSSLLVRRRGC